MLTSVARAALRRVVLTRTPATTASSALFALPIRSGLQLRSFTSSDSVLEAVAAAKKTPTSAGVKKTTVVKKKPAKKAAAKKKVAKKAAKPKKKKAAPKPQPMKLTQEEKDAAKLKQLKRRALLKGPDLLPANTWALFTARAGMRPGGDNQKIISRDYNALTAHEMAELKAEAEANKSANKTQLLQWVETFPPENIALANLARQDIARRTGKKISPIHDARQPMSHVRNAYNFFFTDRLTGRAGRDLARFAEAAQEWKNMSPEDKRPFNEMAEAEKTLVNRQRKELNEKLKVLKAQLREDEKLNPSRPTRSKSSQTKAAETNDIGL